MAKRKKQAKVEIDWSIVQAIMLRSFRGRGLNDEERRYIEKAYKADEKKYGEVHRAMKVAEVDKIRSGKALP